MSLIIQPDYASIEPVRDTTEAWLQILGGDEWRESMEGLLLASHTDYGFSDEDCALFASKLFDNLERMKTSGWIDHDGPSYGLFTKDDVASVQQRCREIRDYWHRGGNLGNFGTTIKVATETLKQLPDWVFGEEHKANEENLESSDGS